jgi:micrococcal nuclease
MYEYRVKKVTKILDGDTIDVDLDLGFNISYSQRVRLSGVDTPESRTRDLNEKKFGLEAKEYVKSLIDNAKLVVIKTEKPDSSEKYGRILGQVFLDGSNISVNQMLIDNGYAWAYDGTTKVKDFEALLNKRSK